ncbi:MAG: hydantoinase/oxoprolinase family protein, partial [Actinomycetota bacterium]|nr:hydantoinase/oxoprolinase family protein [Actinomycetota bacterium]
RGGTEPTVTDANLLLGILAGDASLAGVELDIDAAQDAVGRLAGELSLDPLDCAEGILRVANAEMLRALRVVTVQRGIDPRTHALVAFGGAGPLHAAAIAQELGIGTILCPRASGVLAALGLVISPERRDFQRSVFLSGDTLRAETIRSHTEELARRARAVLGEDPAPSLRAIYELRYAGQSFELPIEAGMDAEPDALRESFESAHEERYGLSDPDGTLELVSIRVSATRAAGGVTLAGPSGQGGGGRGRRARIDGEEVELSVLIGTPDPGATITSPAVVELPESTLLVPEGWEGTVDSCGSIRLERGR